MDDMEEIRRGMLRTIPIEPDREHLEAIYGIVWDSSELRRDFEVYTFLAPFVVVRRKADGVMGTLQFQHHPRFYFAFKKDA